MSFSLKYDHYSANFGQKVVYTTKVVLIQVTGSLLLRVKYFEALKKTSIYLISDHFRLISVTFGLFLVQLNFFFVFIA